MKISYLPYWEHCDEAVEILDKILTRDGVPYALEKIIPLSLLPMDDMVNGLLRVETSTDRTPALNAYLFKCMPTSAVSSRFEGLDEASIERIIAQSPGGNKAFADHIVLKLEGDELWIMFNKRRIR